MNLPAYELFEASCKQGLSVVRPLAEPARLRDDFGWNFGSAWPPSYEAFGRFRALIALQQARSLRPRRVLEVAAGDGALCACLAVDGIAAVANDLRAASLQEALACFKNADSIGIAPGNLFDLDPAQTGRFDLVIACEVIEHVAHPDDFLRHLKALLLPNGRLLLTTPNGSYFHNRLPNLGEIDDLEKLESGQFKPDADGHLFAITPAELRTLAAQAALRVETIDLFATPLLTGHCGLSRLRGRGIARQCYFFERWVQTLPWRLREKLSYSMTAVLAGDGPGLAQQSVEASPT
ncbi:MAG TPA: methyltransferase domain-containing protein [Candidatus Binataceae bacterium]|nr:methyltransferase domain-containing protein [Candidatus Binataceae bacterium]